MFDAPIVTYILAQDAALPPVPGEAAAPPTAGTPTTATPGAPGGGTPPAGGGGGGMGGDFLLIMLLLLGGMIVFSMMGQRRERKKREAMLHAIKKHDRVQTVGGVIGSVVEIKPEYVVLKVDESSNTRITFSRSAIQQVLTVAPEPAGLKAESTG